MTRGLAITLGTALLLSGVLAFAFRPSQYAPYQEGRAYVAIASDDYGGVYSYYGGRVLHPLVAKLVARAAHVPIDASVFIWISAASLVGLFLLVGAQYGMDYASAGGLGLVFLVTAAVVDAYRNYYWHDLFYAALCALFFLLMRASLWTGLPLVFLLYLTRESTVVLVASVVVIALLRRQWKFCLAAVLLGLAAAKVDSALVARAVANRQGFSPMLLDILKIPFNFAYNVCGVQFWTNTNAAFLEPPIWVARVPSWLQLGNIHEVGYAGFFWERPARTLLVMSTAFGILPLVVVQLAAREWRRALHSRFEIATAFLYGVLMFLLTPLVGTLPERYVLYAWPLFWLVGVDALQEASPGWRKRVEIVAVSLVVSWIPALVRLALGPSIQPQQSVSTLTRQGVLIALALVIPLYIWTWRILERRKSSLASGS